MHWIDICAGAGSGATTVTLVVAAARSLLTRAAKDIVTGIAADIKEDLHRLDVKFTAQTSGNSNGLRQKLDEVANDVSELKGAFGQHVKDAAA